VGRVKNPFAPLPVVLYPTGDGMTGHNRPELPVMGSEEAPGLPDGSGDSQTHGGAVALRIAGV